MSLIIVALDDGVSSLSSRIHHCAGVSYSQPTIGSCYSRRVSLSTPIWLPSQCVNFRYNTCYEVKAYSHLSSYISSTIPDTSLLHLFPSTVHGFNLNKKTWETFEVDKLDEISFDERAWDHLVLDKSTKVKPALLNSVIEMLTKTTDSHRRLGFCYEAIYGARRREEQTHRGRHNGKRRWHGLALLFPYLCQDLTRVSAHRLPFCMVLLEQERR